MIREKYKHLKDRFGLFAWEERIRVETEVIPNKKFRTFTHNILHFHFFIRLALKILGFYKSANQNYKDIKVFSNVVKIPNLPNSFDGYKILQLTDLHVDLEAGSMIQALRKIIPSLNYDLCVLTGDYRNGVKEDNSLCIMEMQEIIKLIKKPIFGTLGNHDSIQMVDELEKIGLPLLLNESQAVKKAGDSIQIIGIDDPEFFKSDDLEKAFHEVDDSTFNILLSHSPCSYDRAIKYPVNLMLCGHTHGGQVCFFDGSPILTSSSTPRIFCQGAWQFKKMMGYTSRGTGACKIPIRINCPAEVTIHKLVKGGKEWKEN